MSDFAPHILIIDDEADFASGMARHITSEIPGSVVFTATGGREGLERMDAASPDILLLDLVMPGMDGHQVLPEALKKNPHLAVIILTAHGSVETAVHAMKNGAWDFLTKPVATEDLLRCLRKAIERTRLLGENKRLAELMARSRIHRDIIGDSPIMHRLKDSIAAVAGTGYTVLILGESGTGKELVAESIHGLSERADKPFIRVNCPAIPEQLLESELFGHVKGAFTGAASNRKGLFLEANGGTILLDEIGDIPLTVQTKLLRVLQDKEIRPVGAAHATRADVRVLAATNVNLEEKLQRRLFREDLYYRLKVLTLTSPPLRERREDIPLLAGYFLRKTCAELDMEEKRFAPDALAMLCRDEWPGNVRELQNAIRRMAVFSPGPIAEYGCLRPESQASSRTEAACEIEPYKKAKQLLLDSFTQEYVDQLLHLSEGNISKAARISGLERVSLQKILKRLKIDPAGYKI